jgi:hypothetical protein
LHQHQREVKTVAHRGKELNYIEVSKADITLANSIAHQVLGRTLDELPPQTRNLLVLLRSWSQTECAARTLHQSLHQKEWRFTRKALREHCHWGDTQLKVHLGRLVEFEHVLMHRKGLQCDYELVYDAASAAGSDAGQDGRTHMNGLLDASTLEEILPIQAKAHEKTHAYDATRSGSNSIQSGSGRPWVGGQSASGRGGVNQPQTRMNAQHSAHSPLNGFKPQSTGASSLAAGPAVGMGSSVGMPAGRRQA